VSRGRCCEVLSNQQFDRRFLGGLGTTVILKAQQCHQSLDGSSTRRSDLTPLAPKEDRTIVVRVAFEHRHNENKSVKGGKVEDRTDLRM